MKIERTKNAARNTVFGILLKMYQIIVPFIMRTVILYHMGVEYVGLDGLFLSILQVLNLAELGVGSAMVFSMYQPIAEDNTKKICALMRLYKLYYSVIGMVVLIAGLFLLPFIPHLIKSDIPSGLNIYVLYMLNLSATVLSYWLFSYKNSILQAHQRVDMSNKVMILTTTVKFILQLLAIMVFHNFYYFMSAIILTQVLNNLLTAIVADKMYPDYKASGRLEKKEIREINRKIKDVFTAKLGYTIVNSADTIVISAFLGLTTLAIYQNYYYIMYAVVGIMMVFLNACTAGIGNSLITESLDKNYQDFEKLFFVVSWTAGTCVCCFLCLYQSVIRVWVGEELLLPFSCVILFCIYFYLYTTNHLFATYKDAAGIWHEDRFRPLAGAGTNLILNLLMVRRFGIYAILLSTILSYVLVTIPWMIHNLFSILFKRSARPFLKKMFCSGGMTVIAACICYLCCRNIPETGALPFVLRIFVGVLIPTIVFFIVYRNRPEFFQTLDLVDRITKGKTKRVSSLLRRGV